MQIGCFQNFDSGNNFVQYDNFGHLCWYRHLKMLSNYQLSSKPWPISVYTINLGVSSSTMYIPVVEQLEAKH